MPQPVTKPSCSSLLRLLPPSSAYDSPCFPPPAHYTDAARKASFAKLLTYFQTHDPAHLFELKKCVVKHMPRTDWQAMHSLAESAYKRAKADSDQAVTSSRR